MDYSMNNMDNDTRGWIMCITSGIACIVGASIICVDLLIQRIPSKKNFRIQDSKAFLASSYSLSFGVMIFSSLFSMLPSSKQYLIRGGYEAGSAAWILLGSFTGGFVAIQTLSRFLHQHMPSHVVDCDHTHESEGGEHSHNQSRGHSVSGNGHGHSHSKHATHANSATESTALLPCPDENGGKVLSNGGERTASVGFEVPPTRQIDDRQRRPSMIEVQKRVLSFVKDTKTDCDLGGPCFGYSDPCGQECYKHVIPKTPSNTRNPSILRTKTGNLSRPPTSNLPPTIDEEHRIGRPITRSSSSRVNSALSQTDADDTSPHDPNDLEAQSQHHHHVPENAYMSMGLQTSIAIALHKLPEGFITYATNHANPSLGFSVFMALSIHNITEGFAMALPLYLALGSRKWAMFWASLLGGVSQPFGAAIAAAWFKLAGSGGHKPGEVVYGCMFAITAGVMCNVGLQLFAESLNMNHNRNLCIGFAFLGMAILGMSNALTS